jgi:apolipoprotein N-acyltransferase
LLTAGALRRGAGEKIVAVLVDRDGRLLGSSEKEILVPGGETVFFLDWLPATWRISILQRLRELSPALAPAVFGGDHSPLLQLPGGTRFAAPICFENAFAAFCARRTAEGAEFFCVLSNEGWFRGGLELDQMVAMTVMRALETGRPFVRATMDGLSVAIDERGVIRDWARDESGRSRQVPATMGAAVTPRSHGRLAVVLTPWLGWAVWLILLVTVGVGWRLRKP